MFLNTPDNQDLINSRKYQKTKVDIEGKEYTQYELRLYAGAFLAGDYFNVPKRLVKYFKGYNFKVASIMNYIRKYKYCLEMNEIEAKHEKDLRKELRIEAIKAKQKTKKNKKSNINIKDKELKKEAKHIEQKIKY